MRCHLAILALLVVGTLAGCSRALNWSPEYHQVRSGETLFSIAQRYELDAADIARWNQLGRGDLIFPGQRLRLFGPKRQSAVTRPGRSPVKPKVITEAAPSWQWPVNGRVLAAYGATARSRTGIRIDAAYGTAVQAAAGGEVVYAGDGLPAYGLLLIVQHSPSWLSAYGFNSELLVQEGARINPGQTVARVGRDAAGTAQLHFEIRKAGEPVDPISYLPQR